MYTPSCPTRLSQEKTNKLHLAKYGFQYREDIDLSFDKIC